MKTFSMGNGIYWTLAFVIVFLLSQDYLFIHWENRIAWFGLPGWLYWFVFIHILFISLLYWFAKRYWSE